jgi:hypothetical protein
MGHWGQIGTFPASKLIGGGIHLFAVVPNGNIFRYDYPEQPGKWTQVGGPGGQFVAGPSLGNYAPELWALTPDKKAVMAFTDSTNHWAQIGGAYAGLIGGGQHLYAWKPGILSVVTYWRYEGSPNQWTEVGTSQDAVKVVATSGIVANLWGISPDGQRVLQFTGTPNKWAQVGGSATSLIGGGDQLYAVGGNNQAVWRYDGTPNKWTQVGGPGVGWIASGPHVYGLGDDHHVFQFDGTPNQWTQSGGSTIKIADLAAYSSGWPSPLYGDFLAIIDGATGNVLGATP